MALTQIATTDSVSASLVNTKIVDPANTAISGLQIAQTAGGTGAAITLTGIELTNGYQKTFVINASNGGVATTINGKPLYKPGGTVAPNLTAGKAATVWYNLAGDCFFIKASAEGTAAAGDVLAGKTFSNDDDVGIAGALSLIGTAGVGDVVSGKTFYNTDAKTVQAGTGSGAKRIASGSFPALEQYSLKTISGLQFRPSMVRIYSSYTGFSGNRQETVIVDTPYHCVEQGASYKGFTLGDYNEPLARILSTDTNNAINSDGFKVKIVSKYLYANGPQLIYRVAYE